MDKAASKCKDTQRKAECMKRARYDPPFEGARPAG